MADHENGTTPGTSAPDRAAVHRRRAFSRIRSLSVVITAAAAAASAGLAAAVGPLRPGWARRAPGSRCSAISRPPVPLGRCPLGRAAAGVTRRRTVTGVPGPASSGHPVRRLTAGTAIG